MVRAVLNRAEVIAHEPQQFHIGALPVMEAADVVGDLARLARCFAAELLAVACDGEDLPAAAQPDLLGRDRLARDPPGAKPPVVFLPLELGWLREKKRAGQLPLGPSEDAALVAFE